MINNAEAKAIMVGAEYPALGNWSGVTDVGVGVTVG